MEQNTKEHDEVKAASSKIVRTDLTHKYCVIQSAQHGTIFDTVNLGKFHMDIVKRFAGVRGPRSAGRVTFTNEFKYLRLFGESEGYGVGPYLPLDRFLAEKYFYDCLGISDDEYKAGRYLSVASHFPTSLEFKVGRVLVNTDRSVYGEIREYDLSGTALITCPDKSLIQRNLNIATELFFEHETPKDRDFDLQALN